MSLPRRFIVVENASIYFVTESLLHNSTFRGRGMASVLDVRGHLNADST